MTDRRKNVGQSGEDLAADFLRKQGYKLLQRNYRCASGEIDLVAQDGKELVFVEVRTKQRPCLFRPEESMDRRKALRLVRLGEYYLTSTQHEEVPWRIDLVAVELTTEGKPARIEHFKNATSGIVTP